MSVIQLGLGMEAEPTGASNDSLDLAEENDNGVLRNENQDACIRIGSDNGNDIRALAHVNTLSGIEAALEGLNASPHRSQVIKTNGDLEVVTSLYVYHIRAHSRTYAHTGAFIQPCAR
jgi:hypothetical protein